MNNRPKKGEKRVKPAIPGFLFIPEEEFEIADDLQKRRIVPQFRALLTNGEVSYCQHKELLEFDKAVTSTMLDLREIATSLNVGDWVRIHKGPFIGFEGKVLSVYVDVCLMVKLTLSVGYEIRLPAAFIAD